MTVESCPADLWDRIVERDGGRCLRCGSTYWLTLQHLINRAGCPKALRWHPINLCTLCGGPEGCQQGATDERPGYQEWNVSKFGDSMALLEAFWKRLGRDWRLEA